MTVGIPRDTTLTTAHVFVVVDYAQALADSNRSNNAVRVTTTPINISSVLQRTLVSASIDAAAEWNSSAGPCVLSFHPPPFYVPIFQKSERWV